MSTPPLLETLAYDPILAKCKLIAEAWDAGGLYQVGSFPAYGRWAEWNGKFRDCLLYTSDAADERSSVDLGGRRIIKKKKTIECEEGLSATNQDRDKPDKQSAARHGNLIIKHRR